MFALSEEILPPPTPKGVGASIYPFANMDVGRHFDAPRDMGRYKSGDKRQNSIVGGARAYAKRHNPTAKFTVRVIDENTVRCWRVA